MNKKPDPLTRRLYVASAFLFLIAGVLFFTRPRYSPETVVADAPVERVPVEPVRRAIGSLTTTGVRAEAEAVAPEAEAVAPVPEAPVPEAEAPVPARDRPAFAAFVQRRIPRSDFRTAGASQAAPPSVAPPPAAPPRSTFEVNRIDVNDFPAALATHRRVHARNDLARAAAGSPPFQGPGRNLSLGLWDQMAVRASRTENRPRIGPPTHDGWYDLSLLRLHPAGRFDLRAQLGDRNDDLYLARGYLGFESRTGWFTGAGDQTVGYNGPALHGTTARGFRVEHARRVSGSPTAWRAGAMVGRAAVQHANVVDGYFPRRLEAAYLSVDQLRRQSLEGVAYHFDDRDAESPDGFQSGSGFGVAASVRRTGMDLRGEFGGSAAQAADGSEQRGVMAGVRGRGDAGPVTLTGRFQEADGAVYEVGSLGVLQRTPRRIEDANLSVRPGSGTGLSLWTGRWSYAPSVSADSSGSTAATYALEGNRWGGRASWRSPRGATGLSASRELRKRFPQSGAEEVVTRNVSVSQRIRRGLSATVVWNQLDYTRRAAYNYVTGSLSLRTGKSGTLTLQQRTLWQEPLGPRLESIADLSSLRALAGRLLLSFQFAVTHEEQADGRFHRTQTQGRMSGDYRLGPHVRFTGRYQLSHTPGGEVHGVDLALSHQLGRGRGRDAFSGSGLDPVGLDRQIVTGRVFEDRNRDGEWQYGEPGVPGVEIAIDGDPREPVVTDLKGVYRAFLLLGRHFLRPVAASVPTEYALGSAGSVAVEVMRDRTAGTDFPLVRRAGSIEGFVLDDRTGSGVPDVKISLSEHLHTYTDAAGAFRFRHLASGDYDARIGLESLPFGHRPVGPGTILVRVEESGETGRCGFRIVRPIRVTEF